MGMGLVRSWSGQVEGRWAGELGYLCRKNGSGVDRVVGVTLY